VSVPSLTLEALHFCPLSEKLSLGDFDCDDTDINEFLKVDSINYQKDKMSATYLFLDDKHEVVAFFSVCNDCLKDEGETKGFNKTVWNRLHRHTKIPNAKRRKEYPAVKIGRLGVAKPYQGTGLAYEMMDFIKGWLLIGHKPAFRFLLLDAYNKPKQLKYYDKNGFSFLLDDNTSAKTRPMYFDMMRFN